jgi:CRISPR-associated endonuclease/helicase Cas3
LFKDKIGGNWDNKDEKESHEGKTLSKHIEEVRNTSFQFLQYYNDFPAIFYEVASYLAEYHDYGKLQKNWNLENKAKRLPPHSPLSVQWLMENKRFFEYEREWTLILWYLILKHHSQLTNIIGAKEYRPLAAETCNRISKFENRNKIDLADVFGIFKIADILSASNKSAKLNQPKVTLDKVRKIIGGAVNEEVWKQQLELQKLSNFGLLRAPTGWGKTTASLLYFQDKPVKKVFFLLPTITAINKFYDKLSRSLSGEVTKYFYLYDAELSEENDELHEMFFSENFMSPYVITTIDQFLLAFLQYGRYHTKRIMFRDAGLVFDEIHLLNPVMLGLTKFFLEKYAENYKLNSLFMSATLPNALSQFLISGLGISSQSFLDFAATYYQQRRVRIAYKGYAIDKDVHLIVEKFLAGKKILVMLNTVDRAIEIARKLRECVPEKDVILIHARSMYRDRSRKEKDIDNKKDSAHILVSTQVAEVSLDISYNELYTELSPIASLVQRLGRVNRKGEHDGMIVTKVNVYVYEPPNDCYFNRPYEPDELDLSRKIVQEVEGDRLESEGQLLDLFNNQYSFEQLSYAVDNALKRFDFEAFDEIFGFFSLETYQDRLMNVLNYRESFNAMVIPHPDCICDNGLKNEVENIISHFHQNSSFDEKRVALAKIKAVAVSVPIMWVKKEPQSEGGPFPIVSFRKKVYDPYYGLAGAGNI